MEKTGKERPWKSQERFPLSHSSNNNKLLLTIVITFYKIQLPASLRSDC